MVNIYADDARVNECTSKNLVDWSLVTDLTFGHATKCSVGGVMYHSVPPKAKLVTFHKADTKFASILMSGSTLNEDRTSVGTEAHSRLQMELVYSFHR